MPLDTNFDLLAHVVEIANTSVDVGERLDSILGAVHSHLQARLCVLFTQEQSRGPLVKANHWPKETPAGEVVRAEYGQGKIGETARRREPQALTVAASGEDPALAALCAPGELAALFPVMDDNRLYAVLLLVFEAGRVLEPDDVRLLQMVTREMAGSIRNFRLYFEAKKRIAELSVLSELGSSAVSTIEVDQLLGTVAGICAKLLGARGSLLTIDQANGVKNTLRASHGAVPDSCRHDQGCCADCPMLDRSGDRGALAAGNGPEHGLCSRLSFKGRYKIGRAHV
jgi:K+-sensing histidine kinase KdpD